jgi:hypothetical protein
LSFEVASVKEIFPLALRAIICKQVNQNNLTMFNKNLPIQQRFLLTYINMSNSVLGGPMAKQLITFSFWNNVFKKTTIPDIPFIVVSIDIKFSVMNGVTIFAIVGERV